MYFWFIKVDVHAYVHPLLSENVHFKSKWCKFNRKISDDPESNLEKTRSSRYQGQHL